MSHPQQLPTNKIIALPEPGRGDGNDTNLDSLIASIQLVGLLHPITVTPDGDNYKLLAGARRLAAMRALQHETVPAMVKTDIGKESQHAISALENLERKQLDPCDEALMCAAALDELGDVETVAKTINRTNSWVQSRLSILHWPEDLAAALRTGHISLSAAAPLARITDPASREFYLTEAIRNGASAYSTRQWYRAWQTQAATDQSGEVPPQTSPDQTVRPPPVATINCLVCRNIHTINEVSHLPLCGNCLLTLREASAAADREAAMSSTPREASDNVG